jgi:hypothetical protein
MRTRIALASCFVIFPSAAFLLAAEPMPKDAPSRPPVAGCSWERKTDTAVGLRAWVQRCDFGSRKIDFLFTKQALAVRYSDGGAPEPVVEVLELRRGESTRAGIRRLFAARTDAKVARRCVLTPLRGEKPAGVERYTFVPDARYREELAAKANPDEVPDPPCGDWGEAPDGIQYFEAQPTSGTRSVLFARVGQDEPLFDEKTLRLLPRDSAPPKER